MHRRSLLGLAWLFHLLVLSQCVCDYKTSNHIWTLVGLAGCCAIITDDRLMTASVRLVFRWRQQLFNMLCFFSFISVFYSIVPLLDQTNVVCELSRYRELLLVGELKGFFARG